MSAAGRKPSRDDLRAAARALVASEHSVALTGAGISVDSGIPDFRSPGGLWSRFDPMEYATLQAFLVDPEKVWKMIFELRAVLAAAHPNPGHMALARLEALGKLACIVTQNVDCLHQDAGSKNVIEFHGNNRRLICLGCGKTVEGLESASDAGADRVAPRCEACDRVLKPDVVFFGEAIPGEALTRAQAEASRAGAALVVGTSALVAPANLLPHIASRAGAKVIEVNLEPTELTDSLTDVFLEGSSSEVLPALIAEVERLLGEGQ